MPSELVLMRRVAHACSITLSEPRDFAAVARKWRGLEERADLSFFQSWTWMGCQVEARFPRPVLLQAGPDEAPVALALLNRAGTWWTPERLLLGESGNAALDTVFIEHNAPLLARGYETVLADCVRALLNEPIAPRRRTQGRSLRLSGVSDALLEAAGAAGAVRLLHSRPAPFVDLAVLGNGEDAFLAGLSANARYQLRRSLRRYQAIGPLAVRRAGSIAEAEAFLLALARLHQATWQPRGQVDAFANPAFLAFHQELIARALPRGEADLLCVSAGGQVLGYLYNFVFRDQVSAYQSGFDYAAATRHQKPGLTSHCLAIEMYRREGRRSYDFLAGDDRYKTSHSNATAMLHWLEVAPRWSVQTALNGMAELLHDWRGPRRRPSGSRRP